MEVCISIVTETDLNEVLSEMLYICIKNSHIHCIASAI